MIMELNDCSFTIGSSFFFFFSLFFWIRQNLVFYYTMKTTKYKWRSKSENNITIHESWGYLPFLFNININKKIILIDIFHFLWGYFPFLFWIMSFFLSIIFVFNIYVDINFEQTTHVLIVKLFNLYFIKC